MDERRELILVIPKMFWTRRLKKEEHKIERCTKIKNQLIETSDGTDTDELNNKKELKYYYSLTIQTVKFASQLIFKVEFY